MNRREALLALTGLPAVARIHKADLKPDDVIVIESDEQISMDMAERIRINAERVWPGRKIVVLDGGVRMRVVSQ